jgi:hypothetical protein
MANASANPSVVARPASLPPRSKASGIIASASMVSTAPPANASTMATVRGDAPSSRTYGGLGDPVQHGPQHDRHRRPARRLAAGLAVLSAQAFDERVSCEERHCAAEQPERDAAPSRGVVDRLSDQLVRHRADQHACAEGHDHADPPRRHAHIDPDEPAQHER